MKRDNYEDFLNQLDYKKNIWYTLNDIDSFILTNGIGIYPNWCHTRFLFKDNDILVQHGYSKPYGARLTSTYAIGNDRLTVQFPPGKIIIPTDYYSDFRMPKSGDILVSSAGKNRILSESLIRDIIISRNVITIYLSNPVITNQESRFSFYDPTEFNHECNHGNIVEGIYMKFYNNPGRVDRKLGTFHEIIRVKDISEVILCLSSKKTYNIRG